MDRKKSYQGIAGLLVAIVFVISAMADASSDKIKGKAVYSDDLSPVSGGTVEILTKGTAAMGSIVLGKATINPDGTFYISRSLINQTDDIKIMAYPNDVDGTPEFNTTEFTAPEVIVQTKDDVTLLLKVQRNSVGDKR